MTLRTRVGLAAGGAAALCLLLVAVLLLVLEREDLRRGIDRELTRQAATVASAVITSGEVSRAVQPGPLGVQAVYAQAVGADGTVVPLTTRDAVLPVTERTLAVANGESSRYFDDLEIDGVHVRSLTVPVSGGAVQVAHQMEALDLHLLHVAGLLSLLVVLGVGAALVSGRLVARAALRPVTRLARDAETITSPWAPGQQLTPTGDKDLRRLVSSLNALLRARDEALLSQRQLVADAAHELRTPLTSVQANLQVLLEGKIAEPDWSALAHDLAAEMDDLAGTVDDLLELAREQDQGLDPEEFALDEVVGQCVGWCRHRHPHVDFDTDLEPVMVMGHRSQAAKLVVNLLDNAAKWSHDGAAVEVNLTGSTLAVRDHGPGIAVHDLPLVFDRFYRSDLSRGTPGAGLGLAIVRRVADVHGWSVQAANSSDGGAILTVTLIPRQLPPLSQAALRSEP